MADYTSINFTSNSGVNQTIFYIRFGALLKFIETDIMYYADGDPLLKFDVDVQSNLMHIVSEYQTSMDPSICIINRNLDFEGGPFNITKRCSPAAAPFVSSALSGIKNAEYGQIMNIYVSMSWILLKLDELKNAGTNKVALIDFLTSICGSINSALGGISNLEPTIDETTNTVIIRDGNPLPYSNEVIDKLNGLKYEIPTDLAEFTLFGYTQGDTIGGGTISKASFIKDFSFTTELSPGLSTMIIVGATANSEVAGENSTAFSKFNVGLQDRFKKNIVQGSTTKSKIKDPSAEDEYEATREKFTGSLTSYFQYIRALDNGQYTKEEGIAYSDLLGTLITYKQQYRQALTQVGLQLKNDPVKFKTTEPSGNSFSSGTGFIPFNLSLTMEGLSGMKIYNKFLIDTRYLPANYPDNAEFLIKNIVHRIENSKWLTTLESIVISKGGKPARKKNLKTGFTSNSNSASGGSYPVTPVDHINIPDITPLRNAIIRIAKSYVGVRETGGDNLDFNDPTFKEKMKKTGWSSSPLQHWCNYFTILVWQEAYAEIGATDPAIKDISTNLLNNGKIVPPQNGNVFTTADNLVKLGYGYYVNSEMKNTNLPPPTPGDLVIYSSGHINICIDVDRNKKTFTTLGGNEGKAGEGKVKIDSQYWTYQKIKAICRPPEPGSEIS